MKQVSEGKRNFPCHKSEQAITVLHRWGREEYAELIAPSLYALEQGEEPPRVFSDVLRAWGLQPRAPLDEQYIPDPREAEDPFRKLRDPQALHPDLEEPKGYLSRLFRRR